MTSPAAAPWLCVRKEQGGGELGKLHHRTDFPASGWLCLQLMPASPLLVESWESPHQPFPDPQAHLTCRSVIKRNSFKYPGSGDAGQSEFSAGT